MGQRASRLIVGLGLAGTATVLATSRGTGTRFWYEGLGIVAAIAALIAAGRRSTGRGAWVLLAAGLMLFVGGDAARLIGRADSQRLGMDALPTQVVSLAGSVLLIGAGLRFVRARAVRPDVDALIDAALVAIAGCLLALGFTSSRSRGPRSPQDLHRALARGELRLFYQPIVDLRRGGVVHVEALVRWLHPERGLLMPEAFLPLAEASGTIVDIERWTLREGLRQLAKWRTLGGAFSDLTLAVNVSPRHLREGDLAAEVEAALEEWQVEGSSLCLEIVEGG